MAITSVSVNTIAGYISKGTLSNTYAATAVAALLDGNGNFQNCYESWIDSSIGYRMDSAVGSDLDSNVFCSFKFDPAILNGSSELIDLYDSTSNTSTALPTDNAGTWEGMAATTTAVAITQTTSWDVAGIGNITPTNTTTAAVNWPSATKTGTDYETRNGTTGKTFCFWYYPRTETPDAFLYQICDNTEDAATSGGNYSGVNIQRTSTIRLSFTVMMGNNGGTGSGNRRTHLGVRDSLTVNEWQFVVVRMISGSGQGVTSNYVNITLASAGVGARSQTNDGISGTSGTYNGAPVYNTSSSRALRFFNQRGSAGNLDDAIGQLWILPFGLNADDSILDDMFDATVGGYS
jgi:hypothetical protein